MRRFKQLALVLLCISAAGLNAACQIPFLAQATEPDGGVSVGNGATYRSPHGFQVEYRRELDLVVESQDLFRIENATLAKDRSQSSRIEFSVLKTQVKDFEELGIFVKNQHPELDFKQVKFPGANGLYFEKHQGGHLNGLYYILTVNKELVYVEIDAYAYANGLEWVAPIVRTFSYDIAPPVVHEFRVDGEWIAGQKNRFYFRATDDYSGVSDFMGTCGSFSTADRNYTRGILLCGTIIALGNDWYAIDVDVSPYVQPGEYTLRGFSLEDKARNSISLWNQDGYYGGQNSVRIPEFKIRANNSARVDVTPPVVHEFRVDGEWIAGQKNRFYFRATDDYSGVSDFMGTCGSFSTADRNYTRGILLCGTIIALGNDWYAIDVDVSPYVQPGEYTLRNFSLEDKARNSIDLWSRDGYYDGQNSVRIPEFKIRVNNSARVDVTPPVLHEFRVDGEWIAGQKNRFYFRATDDYSGIRDFMGTCGSFSTADRNYTRGMSLCGTIIALGNDWYAIDVDVSPFIQPGEYTLRSFSLEDKARNPVSLWLNDDFYTGEPTRVSAFNITVLK